jgi:hypothetical protein
MEKIKYMEVRFGKLNCMHMVMLMSINPRKTIECFKPLGKLKVVENFDSLKLNDA